MPLTDLPPFLPPPDRPLPCTTDPDAFYDPHPDRRAAARALCHTCPVLAACRTWATNHSEKGVWGAWDETDRRRARNRTRNAAQRASRASVTPIRPATANLPEENAA